jgi:hypothetical protein
VIASTCVAESRGPSGGICEAAAWRGTDTHIYDLQVYANAINKATVEFNGQTGIDAPKSSEELL